MSIIIIYILNFLTLFSNSIFIENYLHIYQLRDYNSKRYFRFFLKKRIFYHIFCIILLIFQLIFKNLIILLSINLIILIINSLYHFSFNSSKTPIKYTKKIIRLYIISIIFLVLLSPIKYYPSLASIFLVVAPVISNFMNLYDRIKNNNFIKKASEKIKLSQVKIIAITGSNGKTSVKQILNQFLKIKYKILATPKSFNTPLGIAKFVNENDIDKYDFLILEYGARKKGDIKKLCSIYGADYGIITLIAPQHLESFRSIENVYRTKNELSEFLKTDLCIYNIDNLFVYRSYFEKPTLKVSTSIYSKADIYATNIKIKDFKTYFTIHINNQEYEANTRLLGRHNVTNILLAFALAINLGINSNALIKCMKNLNYIPHRLELIKTHLNILDDSYNCSLASAKESTHVLSQFENKKMVVTPGIIEVGKSEYNINFRLGQMCAKFDYLIIVGKHNKSAIKNGASSEKTNCKIILANSLNDARKYFKLLKQGDNILLLNDLPDDYN